MFQIENKLCVILDESRRNKKNSALRDMLALSTGLKRLILKRMYGESKGLESMTNKICDCLKRFLQVKVLRKKIQSFIKAL